MADGTHISWTDATWQIVTGCKVLSAGCTNCYAMKLAGTRLRHHPSREGLTMQTKAGPVWNGEVRFNEQWLDQPKRWKRPRFVFVAAHGDLFYDRVPLLWQIRTFNVMAECPHHKFQVLTKRPEVMLEFIRHTSIEPMPHVWLGASAENQACADERREAMELLASKGWNTWVSYEPALGPVDWSDWHFLKWLVSGGESDMDGKSARPSHPDWHRAARDFCIAGGIPYHFKQHGAWAPLPAGADLSYGAHRARGGRDYLVFKDDSLTEMERVGKHRSGAILDGREWREMPP